MKDLKYQEDDLSTLVGNKIIRIRQIKQNEGILLGFERSSNHFTYTTVLELEDGTIICASQNPGESQFGDLIGLFDEKKDNRPFVISSHGKTQIFSKK